MQYSSFIYAILATFFWGTHSVVGRYIHSEIPAELISFARLFIGGLTLFALTTVMNKESVQSKKPFMSTLKDLMPISTVVATNLLLFHFGLVYTTATNAIVLESTAPIFVTLLSPFFFQTQLSKKDLGVSFVAFIGILLIMGSEGIQSQSWLGDGIELLAGVTWGLFTIFTIKLNKAKIDTRGRLRNLTVVLLLAAAILFPFVAVKLPESISLLNLGLLLYLGIFPTATAFALWFFAGRSLPATHLAVIFNLSVVFTTIFSWFFLDEVLNLIQAIGILIVLSTIYLSNNKEKAE